jgi:dienelactone hydrolase
MRFVGKSLGPQADINLHASVPAASGESFLVVARYQGVATSLWPTVKEDMVVRLDLDHPDINDSRTGTARLLADRFGADAAKRAVAEKLLAEMPFDEGVRDLAWQAYKASPVHADLRKEYEGKTVKTPDRTSPYLWRHVGQKPKEGWSLVIAMHGGGGAAKRVNDSQWMGMFERYYKDHPEAGGYVYLALRAPNDAWNGFYDDAICPLIERLIRQFVLLGEVNPDRVYILGASHGGYGAFVIGPKIPDRFAAVHASASAPTDGETLGENLLNTRFTFMVGEKDTAYGRAERCQAFAKQVDAWRKQRGGYPGSFEWRPDVGHSVPDRDKLAEMIKAGPRNPYPKELVWVQSDDVLKHFFWIEAPKPADKARIEASITSNKIRIKAEGQDQLALWLDGNLVDLAQPITIEVTGGQTRQIVLKPSLETFCLSIQERCDPRLAAPMRIVVPLKP